MRVFIAGSRHVSRLDAGVCRRLDNMIEKRLPILVGDANGADKAVQAYLHGKHYDLVQVYWLSRGIAHHSAEHRHV